MSYLGNPLVSMPYPVDYFTGTGTTTTFTLSQYPASASSILVTVNGIKSVASTSNPGYTVNGDQLVFSTPPSSGATIEVTYMGILSQVNVPGSQTITPSMLSLAVSNTLVYQTTANGSQNTFTLSVPPVSANSLIVTANGVVQYDYTLNGTTLYLNFTPAAGTLIRAQSLALAQSIVPTAGSVSSTMLQPNMILTGNTTTGNVVIGGVLTVNGNTQINGALTVTGTTIIENVNITNTTIVTSDTIIAPTVNTQTINSGTSNTLILQSNNTTAITISTGQNVGIGTSSPNAPFVVSNGGVEGLEIGTVGIASAPYLAAYNRSTSSYLQMGFRALQYQWLNSSGNTAFYIDSSGNVGIGTSSPSSKLEVYTTSAASNLRLTGNNFSGLNLFGASVNATGVFLGLDSAGGFTLNVRDSGYQAFSTNNLERMRIDSFGNVGISNTPSTYSRLEINNSGAQNVSWFKNYSGTNSSPTENADWPWPVCALTSYGNFYLQRMLTFTLPNDGHSQGGGVYHTGDDLWSISLNGVTGANSWDNASACTVPSTATTSDVGLQLMGPGNLRLGTSSAKSVFLRTNNADRVTVNSSGVVTIPNQPVFFAYRTTNWTTVPGVVILDNTTINIGSCYNTSTGRFTAPVAGTYQFTLYTMGYTSTSTYNDNYLRKNGSILTACWLRTYYGSTTGAISSMVCYATLAVNDYVDFYVANGPALYSDGNVFIKFGGHLIG